MSFRLRIKNPPSGSVYWWGEYQFYQVSPGIWLAAIQSGSLGIAQEWVCLYGAYGATDLHIVVWDAPHNRLHERSNLGPISDDRVYEYNCATGVLSDVGADPTLAGVISRKELEYNGTHGTIPVTPTPLGDEGLIHIWGRNDTSEAQRMGITWTVRDPSGTVVESYATWEAWPYTGAGKEHEFIGDRFDILHEGNYTLAVELYMYPDSPVLVDSYYGNLCIVLTTLTGTISKKEFQFNGTQRPIPVSPTPQDKKGLVHIWGRNNTDLAQKLLINWAVIDPHGTLVESYSDWSLWVMPGAEHEFIGGRFGIYYSGTYTISIGLYMDPDNPILVDNFDGVLCSGEAPPDGEPEPTPGQGKLTAIVVHWGGYTNLIPPAAVQTTGTFEIHPVALNVSQGVIQFRIEATVTKPSGAVITTTDIDGWPHTAEGNEWKPTLNMGDVDEVGIWTAAIKLYDHDTGGLLDVVGGDLLTVTEAPLGVWDTLQMIPMLIMVMVMSMIMNMMSEPGGFMAAAGERVEKVKKIAAPIIKKAAPVVKKLVSKKE